MATTTLLKALVAAHLGARRAMAQAIKDGRVSLNGQPGASFSQPVETARDRIAFDGQPVKLAAQQFIYFLLNKPPGLLSTTADERGRATVLDLVPQDARGLGLHPVGRLDKDSRGLMLLTNDGDLTYRLTHPRFEKEKEYLVKLDKPLGREDRLRFEAGLDLEEGLTAPTLVRTGQEPGFYHVTLHEGRKRQIRRMFLALGYRVLDLQRLRLGSLTLGSLPEGKVRALAPGEVTSLRESQTKHKSRP
jgi:23S rRNA pseudouridine2605 synthase